MSQIIYKVQKIGTPPSNSVKAPQCPTNPQRAQIWNHGDVSGASEACRSSAGNRPEAALGSEKALKHGAASLLLVPLAADALALLEESINLYPSIEGLDAAQDLLEESINLYL